MNTKEKIFDVSLDLFSKKGYDSVSLREIAEEVGIKKSSIYSHYASKEAILMDIFNQFNVYSRRICCTGILTHCTQIQTGTSMSKIPPNQNRQQNGKINQNVMLEKHFPDIRNIAQQRDMNTGNRL